MFQTINQKRGLQYVRVAGSAGIPVRTAEEARRMRRANQAAVAVGLLLAGFAAGVLVARLWGVA